MSGHSKWSTIKRKKGAQDAKRGQLFTKLAREISVAAREGGGDPEVNFRLRLAIERARAENVPKDNIERAIRRGTGEDKEGGELEEILYEGYGPHGIALIIDVVTDNRNRTVADIRHILTKYNGNMGEAGSVAWQFTRKAYYVFSSDEVEYDELFLIGVDAGAEDVIEEDGMIEIIAPVDQFKAISDHLDEAGIKREDAGLRMVPNHEVEMDTEQTKQVMRVIEALEDLDDVQEVYSNLHLSAEAIADLEVA